MEVYAFLQTSNTLIKLTDFSMSEMSVLLSKTMKILHFHLCNETYYKNDPSIKSQFTLSIKKKEVNFHKQISNTEQIVHECKLPK